MMNVNPQWNILSIILNPRSCPNSPTTGLWPPVMAWGHPIFTPTDFQKWDLQTSQRWDKPWTRAQNTHRNNPLGVLVRPKEGSGGDFWDTGPKVGKNWKKRENLVLAIFWRFFFRNCLVSQKSLPDPSGRTKTPNGMVSWVFWAPDHHLTRRPLVCSPPLWSGGTPKNIPKYPDKISKRGPTDQRSSS